MHAQQIAFGQSGGYGASYQQALPAAVWAALRGDPMVRQHLDSAGRSSANPPIGWFQETPVKMRVNGEQGLVISARGELSAGNATTFWVFFDPFGEARLVLTATGSGIDLRDSYSYGYRTIVAAGQGANGGWMEYKYDGNEYAANHLRKRAY